MKKYKCMNFGMCKTADQGKIIELSEGEELICPDCKQMMLTEVSSFPVKLIIAIAVILIGGGGAAAYFLSGSNKSDGGGTPKEDTTIENPKTILTNSISIKGDKTLSLKVGEDRC